MQPGIGDNNGRGKTRTRVKDPIGEPGGVNAKLSSEVRSPPVSIVRVFGLEKAHMGSGFVGTRV